MKKIKTNTNLVHEILVQVLALFGVQTRGAAGLDPIDVGKLGRGSHIYIYIYTVKLKTGPRLGGFKVKNWSKLKVKNWSKFFHRFPHFYSVFWVFLKTQIVSHCAKIVFLQNFWDVKNEVFEKKIAFFVFVFFMLER